MLGADYATCRHLRLTHVLDALHCLGRAGPEAGGVASGASAPSSSSSVDGTLQCICCSAHGSLRDCAFVQHCEDEKHMVCVHVQQAELYCVACGDFQYCSVWDQSVGKRGATTDRRIGKGRGESILGIHAGAGASGVGGVDGGGGGLSAGASSLLAEIQPPSSSSAQKVKVNKRKTTVALESSLHTRGMQNMGSTCFMNSVLQVLVQNPLLRRYNTQLTQDPFFLAGCKKPAHGLSLPSTNGKKEPPGILRPTACCLACEMHSLFVSTASTREARAAAVTGAAGGGLKRTRLRSSSAVGGDNAYFAYRLQVNCDDPDFDPTAAITAVDDVLGEREHGVVSSALYPVVPTTTAIAPGQRGAVAPSSDSRFRGAMILANLLFSVWNSAEYLASDEQHDAHEFFLALLDGYSVHLERFHGVAHAVQPRPPPPPLPAGATADPDPNLLNDGYLLKGILNETFAGILRSKLTCRGCGHCSTKYEPFMDISLSVDNIKRRSREGITLEDCLRQWCAVEFLNASMTCESCKNRSMMKKTLSISRLPPTLIVHLKRFDAFRQKKIVTPIGFQARGLNMEPYTRHVDPRPAEEDGDDAASDAMDEEDEESGDGDEEGSQKLRYPVSNYDLMGMVSHKGSLNQGHYISYIRVKAPNNDHDLGASVSGLQHHRHHHHHYQEDRNDSARVLLQQQQLLLRDRLGLSESLSSRLQEQRGSQHVGMGGNAEARGTGSPAATTEEGSVSGSARSPSPTADDAYLDNYEWVKCDDDHVSAVKEDAVASAEGYILVYMARDVLRRDL